VTWTASNFERVRRCPASAALPQINCTSQWAQDGIDGHAALQKFVELVRQGEDPVCAIRAVPTEWRPICDSVAYLAKHLRSELAFAYNVANGEGRVLGVNLDRQYKLNDCEVAGTADLAGTVEGVAIVIDLKTGWGEVTRPDINPQLRILALMAARAWGCDRAKVAILTGHEGAEPSWRWAELEAWDLDEVAAQAADTFNAVSRARENMVFGSETPSVTEGSWCKYCPAAPVCPAKTALIRRLASGAEGDELEMMLPLDRRTAGIAWERLGHAKQLLKRVEAACHAYLDEEGQIDLPSGKTLRKVITEGNERLDGEVVYSVTRELCGADIADGAVERRATKSRLEEALREKLGRGAAAQMRTVLDEVRKRGGALKPMTKKLVEVDGEP